MRARINLAGLEVAGGTAMAALSWCTLVAHAVLMMVLAWRWAYGHDSFTALGAVMLSALMLGFVAAAANVLRNLGRPAETSAPIPDEQPDALLLFPAEAPVDVNHRALTPQLLAPRRKALL